MNALKISSAIIFFFLARVAFSSCETYSGINLKEKICWHDQAKAYVSAKCLKPTKCHALKYLTSSKVHEVDEDSLMLGQNPASVICRKLKLPIVILKDPQGNEQSFCLFTDGSFLDSNAVERIKF